MRAIFGIFSLILVLVTVGLLAKKQLVTNPQSTSASPALTPLATPAGEQSAPAQTSQTPQQQSQQIQQQYKQAIDAAMQPIRAIPEEK